MRTTIWTRLLFVLALSALLLVCASCGNTQPQTDPAASDGLSRVLDKGTLVLGLDTSFPPMGFADADGNIVGFDIDVAQEVCNRLGVELETQPISWNNKEAALSEGKIDCIWNGMSVTDARSKSMSLSDPYMRNETVCVVPENSSIHTIADLVGKSVGVQRGSTAEEILETLAKLYSLKVTSMDDNVSLLDDLGKGSFDAVILDSVVAYYCISSNNLNLYVLPGNLGEEEYAIGFRKQDKALRDRVQEVLHEMQRDGKLAEISTKWFGADITTLR